MTATDIDTLSLRVRGLWPGSQVTDERRNQWLLMFERYQVDDVTEAMTRWAATHPDAWPRWGEILELLRAEHTQRADPAAWTAADEVDLHQRMIIERRIAAKDSREPRSEAEIASEQIGKSPSEQERRDAWAVLNRTIDEANARRIRDGSTLRCSHYPGSRYYWVGPDGQEVPPPKCKPRQEEREPRPAERRSRAAREAFDRIHGAEPVGAIAKRTRSW